jgi:hypothetical protein
MSNSDRRRFRVKTTSLGIGGDLHRHVPPPTRDGHSPRILAKASFGIHGDAVEPAFWTDYFTCEPSYSRVKSEDRGFAPSGHRHAPLLGLWLLSTEASINSDQLNPHLAWLVARLALPRPDLGALLRKRMLTSRVFCFWADDGGDRVPDARPEYLDIFRASGIGFEIDEYPQQIGILHGPKTYKAWV